MKSYVELITEVKKSIDQEDNKALANIEDSMESTTVATSNHALGSYLIYDKKVYEVTTAISVGDTLVIYPATGYNIKVADDIMTMIEARRTENQTLTNEVATIVNDLSAKNLAKYSLSTNPYIVSGTIFTENEDKSLTITGTYDGSNHFINLNSALVLDKGTYKLTDGDDGSMPFVRLRDQNDQLIIQKEGEFTLTEKTSVKLQISFGGTSGATANSKLYPMIRPASIEDGTYAPYAMTNRELTEKSIIKDVSGYSWDSAIDGKKDITVKRYGAIVSIYGYFNSTTALAQYANILSGLPHCASGAAKSTDMLHNMGMTLQNVDSATSKFIVDSATTANLQYTFNFVYLTDN